MFRVLESETADGVWQLALAALARDGELQASRAGGTRELLRVGIGIRDPRQRWIVSRWPALNPAFAVAEVVWLINGRNDAPFLNYFNSALPTFAGKGTHYHGAYGHRIRRHLGIDQLERAYEALSSAPESRQVVLQIWDASVDMPESSGRPRAEDIPCNVLTMLKVRSGRLEMTEIVRSNDAYRGLPYNIIQFTSLQEVLAGWLGVDVGNYCQWSDSLHLYERDVPNIRSLGGAPARNVDDLAVGKPESERAFRRLADVIDAIVDPATRPARLLASASCATDLPRAHSNLLRVVVAEGLRRRGCAADGAHVMAECDNPALRDVWSNWTRRLVGVSPPRAG